MPRMTITDIAARLGVHKSTVSRQARKAGLVGADGLVELDEYERHRATGLDPLLQTIGPAATRSEGGEAEPNALTAQRVRKMAADAELAELSLAEKHGRLIDAAQAASEVEVLARRLRDRILGVAREISGDLARLGEEMAIEAHLRLHLARAIDGARAETARQEEPDSRAA